MYMGGGAVDGSKDIWGNRVSAYRRVQVQVIDEQA